MAMVSQQWKFLESKSEIWIVYVSSRRELELQRQKEEYFQKTLEGKTVRLDFVFHSQPEAKATLERLARIRAQREEAARRRKQEEEARAQQEQRIKEKAAAANGKKKKK